MIVVVTFSFMILTCTIVLMLKTNSLGLLLDPQRLHIKSIIDILGSAMDTALQFAFEMQFPPQGHISLGVF